MRVKDDVGTYYIGFVSREGFTVPTRSRLLDTLLDIRIAVVAWYKKDCPETRQALVAVQQISYRLPKGISKYITYNVGNDEFIYHDFSSELTYLDHADLYDDPALLADRLKTIANGMYRMIERHDLLIP